MDQKQKLITFTIKCLVLLMISGGVATKVLAKDVSVEELLRQLATEEMRPTQEYCDMATGLSQRFVEMVGERMKVSAFSIRLLSASAAGNVGCLIRVDTPKGPYSCRGGKIFSDGKDFWIGGDC